LELPLGPRIRGALGPLEVPVGRLYRGYFVDLAQLADEIRAGGPAGAILEVGCGEGSLTEEIAKRFPASTITGIDISPRVGRLYQGDRERVSFRQASVEQIADATPAAYDLVVLADVLHHVAAGSRRPLLQGIRRALRARGLLVVKEWERKLGVAHALAWLGDRFLTGDRVQFLRGAQLRELIESVFGPGCVEKETRIRPQWNNLVLFVRDRS
jgi:2-polyprenyl-6-hydroxyphenyl methylase/3-demethylubiquinone-9 3-methyltransferase